jgi:drug/metabolite transporter (DMT)-like permease
MQESTSVMSSAAERPHPAPGRVRATRLGILAILGPVVAFSLMNIIVKVTVTGALVFAFYRLWLGSAVMIVLLRVTHRRLTWPILRRSALSGVLFGLNICFFFSALKLTSVADVLIIAALQPALTLLVAGRMFGERVTVHEVAWTGVSLVGVVLVIVGASGSPDWSVAGDLLAVGALVAWTTYWLRSKRVREEIPAVEYMSAVTFVAALVVTPLALASGQSFAIRWQDLLWLVVFVAGAQLGHSLLAWSHAQVDVSVSSLMILVEPVISSAAAWLLLGEDLTALTIIGGGVTLLAVGMVIRRATRTTAEAIPPEVAPA